MSKSFATGESGEGISKEVVRDAMSSTASGLYEFGPFRLDLGRHLLSRAGSLNHVAIFLAIAFWSWAWGVPGMLLAVPMLMALKAVCDHVEDFKGVGELLGD